MRRRIIFWCLPLSMVIAQCLVAQPAFFRKDIAIGANPRAVVAGDFNGDNRPDLVVSTEQGLVTLLNAGFATFDNPTVTEAQPTRNLVVGDFDGDGRDDLAIDGKVLSSLGDGSFRQTQGDLGRGFAAVDFNGDKKTDLLAYFSAPGSPDAPPPETPPSVLVWLGNGDGTFQRGAVVTTEETWGAATADFNRDGNADVIVQDLGDLIVFLGNGDGTFGSGVRTSAVSWANFPAADFNGDGIPDIATEDRILLGDGDGNFTRSVWYQTLPDGRPVIASAFTRFPLAATDFDSDGSADVALMLEDRNFILVLDGKGDGAVLPPIQQRVGWGTQTIAATADLDGNGLPDLATVNLLSGSLSLLLSKDQGGPSLRRAVSAASETAIVAPGSLATLTAPIPVAATLSAFAPWPTQLGDISLEVRDSSGATHLAPLVLVSPTQINFQVPADTALGEATLAVVGVEGTVEAGSMQVDEVAPALFMAYHPSAIPAATALRVEPDGTQVRIPVFQCANYAADPFCYLSGIPLSSSGDRPIYVSFYGTGFHGANTENVTCSIGGIEVPVSYAGKQATPGVDQINVRLTPELMYGRRSYDEVVAVRINGVAANQGTLFIQ